MVGKTLALYLAYGLTGITLKGLTPPHFVLVPRQDLNFKRHMPLFPLIFCVQ
jgi:hypothetical protein